MLMELALPADFPEVVAVAGEVVAEAEEQDKLSVKFKVQICLENCFECIEFSCRFLYSKD